MPRETAQVVEELPHNNIKMKSVENQWALFRTGFLKIAPLSNDSNNAWGELRHSFF